MQPMDGLDLKIMTMAARIHELREVVGLTTAEMARKCAVSEEEYIACENGEHDLAFAFLYRAATALGVDVTDIIEGDSPRLRSYTVTRKGNGRRRRPFIFKKEEILLMKMII